MGRWRGLGWKVSECVVREEEDGMRRKRRWLWYNGEAHHSQRQARWRRVESSSDLNLFHIPVVFDCFDSVCLKNIAFVFTWKAAIVGLDLESLHPIRQWFRTIPFNQYHFKIFISPKRDQRSSWAAGGPRHVQTWGGSIGNCWPAIPSTIFAPTQSTSDCSRKLEIFQTKCAFRTDSIKNARPECQYSKRSACLLQRFVRGLIPLFSIYLLVYKYNKCITSNFVVWTF